MSLDAYKSVLTEEGCILGSGGNFQSDNNSGKKTGQD